MESKCTEDVETILCVHSSAEALQYKNSQNAELSAAQLAFRVTAWSRLTPLLPNQHHCNELLLYLHLHPSLHTSICSLHLFPITIITTTILSIPPSIFPTPPHLPTASVFQQRGNWGRRGRRRSGHALEAQQASTEHRGGSRGIN